MIQKALFFFCLAALSVFLAGAQEGTIVFFEGDVHVRDHNGQRWSAEFGSELVHNDAVYTGNDSFAEIDTGKSSISVNANSVFKFMEAGRQSSYQNAYLCSLGYISMRVEKLDDSKIRVMSNSMAAGVRGTEFAVYAGADGSSLIHVVSGLVDVEAGGATVSLEKDEAVEVKLGQPPGPKFTVRDPIDYSTWNSDRFEAFMKDPVTGSKAVEARMQAYLEKIEALYAEYKPKRDWFYAEIKKLDDLEKKEGREARQKHFEENIEPTGLEANSIYLELRFNMLSALSLRRFVLGRMYLFMKTKYITEPENGTFTAFLEVYKNILDKFEKTAEQHLVEHDF